MTGVELGQSKDGHRYHAKAKKEVIVCSGAYCTPQLLLVSGIGPKVELDKIGVESKVELDGVGRSLKDHLMAGPTYKTIPGVSGHYLLHPVKAVSLEVRRCSGCHAELIDRSQHCYSGYGTVPGRSLVT